MKSLLKIVGFFLNLFSWVMPQTAGRWAAKLFCYPVRKKLRENHKVFLNAAKWKTIPYKKDTIQMYRWGTGKEVILLAHGWQSHTYRWKRYLQKMDMDRFTIYAFDAPGHGLSTGRFFNVPEYGQLLKKIFEEFKVVDVLIGHSIGGFTSLYGVSKLGLEPNKLIVLASPGDAMDFMKVYRKMFGFNQRIEDNIQRYLRSLYDVDLTNFKAVEFASQLKIPGLIIHDKFDPDCDVEYAKAIHANWENSQLILTQGKGHHLLDKKSINLVAAFASSATIEVLLNS